MKSNYFRDKINNRTAFILLFFLILPIYLNTFHASFQFDDKPNIIDNARLHINDLSPSSLWQTFFAKGGKDAFFRPIPSLTLALNWYFGGMNTLGYHLVNTVIHVLTGFILFLATVTLLQTPKLKRTYNAEDAYFIALLSSVLWAINPIQIQAVTYIVQRMAAMAAMFYILGIYFYLRGRLEKRVKIQIWLYATCFFSFLGALMSKENAVMFPAILILVEIIFFQSWEKVKKNLPTLAVAGIVLFALGIIALKTGAFDSLLIGYATRPFTMMERLLTEPRIVLFYLSQIFYPLPARLSISHDILISRSLWSPWTTLPAILVLSTMIVTALIAIKKYPLQAFAILFFFLNHIIESSFIPVELIFEHRNYLPSLFIFLPVSAGIQHLFTIYRKKNRAIYVVLAAFITLIIMGFGCFTYIRNKDWRTESTLWRDAMKKAPQDARPVCNLAIQIAWSENPEPMQYEVAMAMFRKALTLNTAQNHLFTDTINNIGMIYYKKGQYQQAVGVYRKGLEIDPDFLKMRYDLISALIMLGEWEEGLEQADFLIQNKKNYIEPDYYKLKGFILLWRHRPNEALYYFRKALKMEPDNRAVLLNAGVALSLMGKSMNAELFFNKVIKLSPGDIRPFFALIENCVRAGEIQKTEKYLEQLFAQFSLMGIIDGIKFFSDNYRTAPMSPDIIIPVVKQKMLQHAEDLAGYKLLNSTLP